MTACSARIHGVRSARPTSRARITEPAPLTEAFTNNILSAKTLSRSEWFSLPFATKGSGVWGSAPPLCATAHKYASKALKGFGGKQEFSPNIFDGSKPSKMELQLFRQLDPLDYTEWI